MKKILLSLSTIFILFNFHIYAQCWKSISCSSNHCIAIKADGTLWAWGQNSYGELGDGTFIGKRSPIQIGNSTNWKSVSAGSGSSYFSLALKTDGTLWSWGYNDNGQLGDGTLNNQSIPAQVGNDTTWNIISTGQRHCLAIKKDETLWAWGDNYSGQLGDGTTIDKSSPIQIGSSTWKFIDGSLTGNSFGIKTDGSLWSIYLNHTQIGTSTNWKYISVGLTHKVGIKTDGTLWTWGDGTAGALGDGSISSSSSVPIQRGTDTDWETAESNEYFSLATKSNGTLWAWGNNSFGVYGDGTYTSKYIPTQVGTENDWKQITCGLRNSLIIKTDGTLWATGESLLLGNNNTASVNSFNIINCNAISVNELKNENIPFYIYPNPADNILSLTSHSKVKVEKIEIIDTSGKIIFTHRGFVSQIDIANLQTGLYLLRIFFERKCYKLKFVKS